MKFGNVDSQIYCVEVVSLKNKRTYLHFHFSSLIPKWSQCWLAGSAFSFHSHYSTRTLGTRPHFYSPLDFTHCPTVTQFGRRPCKTHAEVRHIMQWCITHLPPVLLVGVTRLVFAPAVVYVQFVLHDGRCQDMTSYSCKSTEGKHVMHDRLICLTSGCILQERLQN